MSDIRMMAQACREAQLANSSLVMATVVSIDGSAYRCLGARMLIWPGGRRMGSLGGLDADVGERSRQVMANGVPTYNRYDGRGEYGDLRMELCCTEAIGVFIERATDPAVIWYLELAAAAQKKRQCGASATVFRVCGASFMKAGARAVQRGDGAVFASSEVLANIPCLEGDLSAVAGNRSAETRTYSIPGGTIDVMIEPMVPPPALIICGAGDDAIPVAAMAGAAGWNVSVADQRICMLAPSRFPDAETLLPDGPEGLPSIDPVDEQTAALVMTHDYAQDREWMKRLLKLPIRYIGLLGSRRRSEKLLAELQLDGIKMTEEMRDRLHTPTGLDIGSGTPDEIAVSVISDIQAVLNARAGGFREDGASPIYNREDRDTHLQLFALQLDLCTQLA